MDNVNAYDYWGGNDSGYDSASDVESEADSGYYDSDWPFITSVVKSIAPYLHQ